MTSSKRGSADRRRGRAARAGGGKAPELFTLGGVRLVRQGVDETSKLGPKHLALLIYLFHEARPMHPSEVTDLLGRGQEEEKETEGLTRAVTWLRVNVPGINIRLTAETVEHAKILFYRIDPRSGDAGWPAEMVFKEQLDELSETLDSEVE